MNQRDRNVAKFQQVLRLAHDRFPYDGTRISCVNPKQALSLRPRSIQTSPKCTVHITDRDCVVDLRQCVLANPSSKILIVNSASALRPGGGVTGGSQAQEEHLCRSSNLYLALTHVHETVQYPLHSKVSGILCPGITFFETDAGGRVIPYTELTADVGCLFSRPVHSNPDTFQLHYNVFKQLWSWLQLSVYDTVVIPPIGCGVFGHPPHEVARALRAVMTEFDHPKSLTQIIVSCFIKQENKTAFENVFKR